MITQGRTRIRAIHPHWSGFLALSHADRRVVHEGHESEGTFDLTPSSLTVRWDLHPPDRFDRIGELFIHHTLSSSLPQMNDLLALSLRNARVEVKAITVAAPGTEYSVTLRADTTDIATFEQVFVLNEYDSPYLPPSAASIIDLGANIGLSVAYFAARYPEAQILAVEPDPENYKQLVVNSAPIGERVKTSQSAAWWYDGAINLQTEDAQGVDLGAWGVRVSEIADEAKQLTPCRTVPSLMAELDVQTIDILKIDVEGAELELFAHENGDWLKHVRLLIIETHDRFRPGSEGTVRKRLAEQFDELPSVGENLFFRNSAH